MIVRGAYLQKPFCVALGEVALKTVGENDVRVQTELSALSAGTELLFYRGQVEAGVAVDTAIDGLEQPLRYPLLYGYANVGRVVETGRAVAASLVGQRVFGFQPHQEQYVTAASQVVVLPEGVSPEAACLLANVETAVSLVMDGAPLWGEKVAVIGQGVVGAWVTGMLAHAGFCEMAAIDRSAARLKRAGVMHTPAVRAYVSPAALPELASFDLVYELTGNPEAFTLAMSLLRREGRVVVGSWYGNKTALLTLGTQAHRNRNTVLFSQVSHIDSKLTARFDKARRMGVALSWLTKLPGPELITHRVPFAAAGRAFALLDQKSEECMQVVLTYP